MILSDALSRLVEPLPDLVRPYAQRLDDLAGDNLQGLAVFGAAAGGRFDSSRDVVQSVVMVRRIDLELLRKLAFEGSWLGRLRIAAPLFMTPEYIAASRDTFPLELIEIQQQHVTLAGPDYFADLTFADADVRLQCERELKAMLVAMHQGVLTAGHDEQLLDRLGAQLVTGLLRVLRGLLWLEGQRQALPAMQVVAGIERVVARSMPGIYSALDEANTAGWHNFRLLYDDLQALGQFADAF